MSEVTRKEFLTAGAAIVATASAIGFVRPAFAEEKDALYQTAELGFDPAKKDEVVTLLKTLTKAVEENEPGVLAYIAHLTEETESKVFFYEVYKDAATLAAHGTTPHLGEMRKAFTSGVLKAPLTIRKMARVGGYSR